MPAINRYKFPFRPGDQQPPSSVRGAYLHNLVNCVHICILRGLYDKARRAWAILVRCPDIDWKERWGWGLFLLTRDADGRQPVSTETQSQTQYSQYSQRGKDSATDYLNKLRLQVKPAQKPEVLEELVLHLIYTGRYAQALEQLELFLVDHPYDKSASLHSYAGLVCFWLAQPESKRREPRDGPGSDTGSPSSRRRSGSSSSRSSEGREDEPANESMLQKARKHFDKALEINPSQTVAKGFIDIIDNPSLLDRSAVQSPSSSLARSRADSVDMLSPSPRPRALGLLSEESFRSRSSTPRSRSRSRADSPPDQGTARSFGAMSLDADDGLGSAFGSGLNLGRAGMGLGGLGGLSSLTELTGLSRNASLADLAEVRSVASDDSRDSMDSLELASEESRTTSTIERMSMSPTSPGHMSVDMSGDDEA